MSEKQESTEKSSSWHWMEETLYQFDKAWNQAEEDSIDPPVIEGFLQKAETRCFESTPKDRSLQLAVEMIKVDLEYRWKNFRHTTLQDYFSRFPELDEHQKNELFEAELEARAISHHVPSKGSVNFQDKRTEEDQANYIGHYKLIEEVGSGSTGKVWLAFDKKLNRQVAIKLLSKEADPSLLATKRLLREAHAVATVDHPSVVKIFDVVSAGPQPYIVQQFIDGKNLAEWLQEDDLDEKKALIWFQKICEATHAAHRSGVIHRDIKPGNVIITKQGEPVLIDFGLAAISSDHWESLTQTGDVFGTPAYMSPQQATGDIGNIDHRSDIYSLGVILFQILFRKLPFSGSSASVLDRVMNQSIESVLAGQKKIHPDLRTLLVRCMQKQPEARIQSAGELARDIKLYLDQQPILARPIGLMERTGRWVTRNPKIAAFCVLFVVLACGLLTASAMLFQSNHQKNVANQLKAVAQQTASARTILAGRLAMQRGQLTKAEALLQTAYDDPYLTPTEAILDLVDCKIALRKISDAKQVLENIPQEKLQADDAPRKSWLEGLLLLEQTKDTGEAAKKAYEKFVMIDTNKLPESSKFFIEALKSDNTKDAIDLLEKSVQLDPYFHASQRLLCLYRFSTADFRASEDQVDTALVFFPEDADFQILKGAILAGRGELDLARSRLKKIGLSEEEERSWKKIYRQLKRIRTKYSYFSKGGAGVSIATLDDISKSFVKDVLPELRGRGFFFPPKVSEQFNELILKLESFQSGEESFESIIPFIEKFADVHPEATLNCWIAGKLIDKGEIEKAQQFFLEATQDKGFIRDTDLIKWKGLFATTAALWSRGKDVERQYEIGKKILSHYESDKEGYAELKRIPGHVRVAALFATQAAKEGVITKDRAIEWVGRAELCGALDKPNAIWIRAVLYGRSNRPVLAMNELKKLEELEKELSPEIQSGSMALKQHLIQRMENSSKEIKNSTEAKSESSKVGSR